MSGAPFDMVGDWLRGTQGIMMDMYQRPAKLHAAMARIVPIAIDDIIKAAENTVCPLVFMPLHKGTGGFMSNKQFHEFYWPTFKDVLMGLINEGLVPLPFAEGDFEPRLDTIKDMPRTSVIWYFEQMDMAHAKRVLGGHTCFAGNVPVSVMCTGVPGDVKQRCRGADQDLRAGQRLYPDGQRVHGLRQSGEPARDDGRRQRIWGLLGRSGE